MKKLVLKNASFRYIEQSFKEWLDILGYAPSTVYYLPLHIRELLYYLEQRGMRHIRELEVRHIESYYERLRERSNQRREGGISNGHLNKHIQALRKFTDYLRKVGRIQLPVLKLGNEEKSQRLIFLTEEETRILFEATNQTGDRRPNMSDADLAAIQSRDRAMLAVYYGCGLRRNEGVQLNVSDIDFDKAILYVRKGKNYKERLVPVSRASLKYMQDYVYDHRPVLSKGTLDAFFITHHGYRMGGQGLLLRLKLLQQRTGDESLMEKEIGLHTLRHSIATHLLQAGMKMESISRFLGHSSLESTQIYTHLAGLEVEMKQPYNNITRNYESVRLHEDE